MGITSKRTWCSWVRRRAACYPVGVMTPRLFFSGPLPSAFCSLLTHSPVAHFLHELWMSNKAKAGFPVLACDLLSPEPRTYCGPAPWRSGHLLWVGRRAGNWGISTESTILTGAEHQRAIWGDPGSDLQKPLYFHLPSDSLSAKSRKEMLQLGDRVCRLSRGWELS